MAGVHFKNDIQSNNFPPDLACPVVVTFSEEGISRSRLLKYLKRFSAHDPSSACERALYLHQVVQFLSLKYVGQFLSDVSLIVALPCKSLRQSVAFVRLD